MDELRFMNRGRYLDLQFLLYRLFLYHAIHNQDNNSCSNGFPVQQYAQKALRTCLRLNDGVALFRRHHGTLNTCRSVITNILLIAAAKESGRVPLEPMAEYQRAARIAMLELAFWSCESPDLVRSREVLGELVSRLGLYYDQ